MKQKAIPLSKSFTKSINIKKIVIEIIVAILLIIWLHTGISKLLDIQSFKIQMYQSPVFHQYSSVVAYAGPILEIILALMLIFKKSRLIGLIGSFCLMLFFSGYVLWLMKNLPHLPCSCGGIVGFLNWPQHLTLNIFLTLISLLGFLLVRKQTKTNRIRSSIKAT